MAISDILTSIDSRLSDLQQARAILAGTVSPTIKRTAGPSKRIDKKTALNAETPTAPPRKRNLSPEGRKRIAEAVKRRWAKQKKAAAPSK